MERHPQKGLLHQISAQNRRMQSLWPRVGPVLGTIAMAGLAALALARFGFELWRMLNAPDSYGSNDLYTRFGEVQRWFADAPVYTSHRHAGYPPASYVLFWPFLGWLPWTTVRWVWAGLNIGTLVVGVRLLLRQSGVEGRREQAWMALLLLAPYPLAVTLGNGQLGILTLTAMLAGLFLLEQRPAWRRDIVAAAFLLFALLKPSLTAPFFLAALFRPGRRLRPILLVVLGYAALTALASSFRSQPLLTEMAALARISAEVSGRIGHAHLPLWLSELGLSDRSGGVTLLVLLALGFWIARNRRADLWPVLGVTAIIGRLASYHGVYDDSLVLLAFLALFRIARQAEGRQRTWARILLVLIWLPLLLPATLASMGLPWSILHQGLAPVLWLAAAIFLARDVHTRSAAIKSAAAS